MAKLVSKLHTQHCIHGRPFSIF